MTYGMPLSAGSTRVNPHPLDAAQGIWKVIAASSVGTMIGKILIPEMVGNVTFGGTKLNRLFICGTTSLYSIYLTVTGSKAG